MGWRNEEIIFEIKKSLGVICETRNGWQKEVNLVSWNGNEPKVDIREWSPDHERMSRGVALTDAEAEQLCMILHNYMRERGK